MLIKAISPFYFMDRTSVEELNRGFADFWCSLLIKANPGITEEDARKKILISPDRREVRSSYKKVPFTVSFYQDGTSDLRVYVCVEGQADLVERLEGELDKVKSNSQLRREKGNLESREVVYDDGRGEIKVDCRIKKIRFDESALYSDVWGYLLKHAIRVAEKST